MAHSNADMLAMKSELANDPSAVGYTGDDAGDAGKINEVKGSITIDRSDLSSEDLVRAINQAEFDALSASERQYLSLLLNSDSVDTSNGTEARTGLMNLFAGGTVTRANIVAMLDKDGSRVDELFQAGTLESGTPWRAGELANARVS